MIFRRATEADLDAIEKMYEEGVQLVLLDKKLTLTTSCSSPLGKLTLASEDGETLSGLWLEGQKYFAATARGMMRTADELPLFDDVKTWLAEYFAGKKPEISRLPLAPEGSEFRRTVWDILCEIPYGQTMTYGQIGARISEQREPQGKTRKIAQAVGGAVAHNPISIIIPCHRVVGKDGSLTGYAGGVEKKEWLLSHEGARL